MNLILHLKKIAYLTLAIAFSAATAGAYEDFFRAVTDDQEPALRELLSRGFDPNSRDDKGQVAIYVALRAGSDKATQLLLQHPQLQADLANTAGETPLMMAAMRGQVDAMRRLLERGATVQREGWTPLHYAASGPSTPAVELLLNRGAAANARSPNGSTPLMMAARYGAETSVAALLAKGADPKLRNALNLSAADFARQVGRDKLAAELDAKAR